MNISDSVNVELLNNVEESLKPILKELLQYIDIEQKEKKSFSPEQIKKIISDLNSGLLQIKLASENNTNEIYSKRFEENPYLKGYYRHDNKNNNKLIVIREESKDDEMLGHLSHEMEHFIDENLEIEEKIKYKYDFWNNNEDLKSKNDVNIIKKIELSEENPRGSFLGNYINSDWLEMWDEATTEILSSSRINKEPSGYLKRVDFLKSVLKINSKNEDDLTQACRNGDVTFIYNLMPKNLLMNISKLESQLYEANINNELIGMNNTEYTMNILDSELLEYINVVKENENFKLMNKTEKEDVIKNILNLRYSNEECLDKFEESKFVNKFETKCKNIFQNVENKEENINFIANNINEWIEELKVSKKIDYATKLKNICLKNLILEKKEKLLSNGGIEEIDKILTEIENRIVHEEKIESYKKGLFEKAKKDNQYFLDEYIDFEKIQKHYVYIDGQKFLNNKFVKNVMTVNLYNINPSECYIKTIIENGEEAIIEEKTYDNVNNFLMNSRNIILKNKLNSTEVEEFRKNNNTEIEMLLNKGFEFVFKSDVYKNKKETKSKKKETFISSFNQNVNLQPSYVKNDNEIAKHNVNNNLKLEVNKKGVNLENER